MLFPSRPSVRGEPSDQYFPLSFPFPLFFVVIISVMQSVLLLSTRKERKLSPWRSKASFQELLRKEEPAFFVMYSTNTLGKILVSSVLSLPNGIPLSRSIVA